MQNEIQIGRLSALLHKPLGMTEGAPSPTLATDIFPTLCLESERPEWAHLAGVRTRQGYHYHTLIAANNGWIALVNPAASGMLVVCEKIRVGSSAGTYIRVYLAAVAVTAGAPVNTVSFLDSRDGLFTSAAQIREGEAVGPLLLSPASGVLAMPAAESQDVPTKYVLAPNSAVLIYNETVNQSFSAWFEWQERALEPSETR